MKICHTCQRAYPDGLEFCPRDGARLAAQAIDAEVQLAAGLSRRFRLVRRLGAGGMGTVFLAEQIGVGNRPVALKVLNRKLLDDPDFLLRFQNEAGSTGRIRHANVVTVYESAQADDGTPYIAMEYLEGETLRQALQGRGAFPVPEAVEILQQAARGLHAAHKLGIIHRDLKPDNIFLTRDDDGVLVVKVVDFGIAKLTESAMHTQTGMVLGTPAYMSYEQASGMRSDELDARSDVYSLGVVVFEMLTGCVPFHSDTPVGFLRKHLMEEPPPFCTVAPGLPVFPEIEGAVLKALAKDRNKRYDSAQDFARELARAMQSMPTPETVAPLPATLMMPPPAKQLEAPAPNSEATPPPSAPSSVVGLPRSKTTEQMPEHVSNEQEPAKCSPAVSPLVTGGKPQRARLQSSRARVRLALGALLLLLITGLPLGYWWWRNNHRLLRTLVGHTGGVESVAFSPDGRNLASGAEDMTVKLWDVATGSEIRTMAGHTEMVNSVAFSPDGQTLASGSADHTVRLWDAATGRALRTLEGHTDIVRSIVFSPGGRTLASGSTDKTIKLWDLAAGREVRTLIGHTDQINSVVFSPDGNILASGGVDATIKLWETSTGRLLRSLAPQAQAVGSFSNIVASLAFSPDGKFLATSGFSEPPSLWEVRTGQRARSFTGSTSVLEGDIAFSPDGRILAFGDFSDPAVILYDVATGRETRSLKGHAKGVASVDFSPDGRMLATGSADNTIKLWRIQD